MKSKNVTIYYGIQPSPFGFCLIGLVDGKLCWLSFLETESSRKAEQELRKCSRKAVLVCDNVRIKPYVKKIFGKGGKEIPLVFDGTSFQMKVWNALRAIPEGKTKTYKEVAIAIGSPLAFRAVGSACGKNPIGLLIPCHRVLASDGSLGGFGWGLKRKKEMLDWEQARTKK